MSLFLNGGAGVGKAYTLFLIVQTLQHIYNKCDGNDMTTKPYVLLMAYTRKATFNVDGTTIHSMHMPLIANADTSLSLNMLDTLSEKYGNVLLVGIDKISLVGFEHTL